MELDEFILRVFPLPRKLQHLYVDGAKGREKKRVGVRDRVDEERGGGERVKKDKKEERDTGK